MIFIYLIEAYIDDKDRNIYMPYKFYTLLFSLFLFSILNFISLDDGIPDLIQPLNLSAGTTDSVLISDIFYAGSYNSIELLKNPFIKVKFNYNKTKLILTPVPNFEGISLIDFNFDNNTYEIPARVNKLQQITFTFKPNKEYKNVSLFGSFNSWNRNNLPMNKKGNIYLITIPLEPGRYQYKLFADGKELIDPDNPQKIPNGMGDYNSVLSIAPKHKTEPFLHIAGNSISEKQATYSFIYQNNESNKELSFSDLIVLINNKKVPEKNINISGNRINISFGRSLLVGKNTLRTAV